MTSTPETAAPRAVNPWIVAVAVMFATFMEVLDTTVVNVSLPHIAGNLSATIEESTWVLTSYLVANAIILPLTGWLATYFGRKRLLLFSVAGFTISSLLCGLAPTLPLLVVFRIIQGATGGAMQPLSQAVLLEAFPPQDRGKAMGFWGLGIVVAPILGPVLGGWLTDSYSWRWVFYINLPVGIASLVMTWLYVFDPPYLKRASDRIDYWGIGMLAVWIGALQIVLDLGQRHDWFESPFITGFAVIAAFTFVAFLVHEWRDRASGHRSARLQDPHLQHRRRADGDRRLRALRQPRAAADHAADAARLSVARSGHCDGAARARRVHRHAGGRPARSGRFDPRKMVAAGLVVGGFTLIWLGTLNLNAGYWDIFWPQFVQGLALSLLFVPMTTITMDPIPRERMGNATSLFNLTRNLGGSIGIAMTSTMLSRYEQANAGDFNGDVQPSSMRRRGRRSTRSAARSSPPGSTRSPPPKRAYAAVEGTFSGRRRWSPFVNLFRGLGILFLLIIPLVFLMRRPARRPRAGGGALSLGRDEGRARARQPAARLLEYNSRLHAQAVQENRLRPDGHEAPGAARRPRVVERAGNRRAVRHSGRADGEGAAAAGAAQAAAVASGHARRLRAGAAGGRRFPSPMSSRRSTGR